MKSIVIYESKYGSTRQYAQWIAGALGCELMEKKAVRPEQLGDYDTIIYGGGLYAGGVSGIELLTKNFGVISDKHLVLFTCGLADPANEENVDHIRAGLEKTLTPEMREKIQLFHLRGGVDYTRLSFVHKAMMGVLHKALMKKSEDQLSEEDKQMLATYGTAVSFVDEAAIEPIVDYVRGL